ncbi:hypothetical protein JQC91_17845 [Jannaschia sp. Os4]|uniref:hypothetical protein n=1 Tax=Jannaschia sp. Os4 TaxID=2807617 RepID=UPI00193A5992|nr:hypothetical protein [Jannaschia sp. Os4]MBM2578174.1 hypothetical protein [Jannaschia sp. Os4]
MPRRYACLSLGTALALILAVSSATADEPIVGPTDEVRILLLSRLSGEVPNFEALARASPTVRSADEFDRADAVAAEVARLNELWSDFDEETAIQINLRGRLGEYDAGAGGFPLDVFAPGTFVGGSTPITYRNASDARIFPVPSDQGRDVVAQTDAGLRGVTVSVTLDRLAPSVVRAGAIEGRIAEVVVTGAVGDELGRYTPTFRELPDDNGGDLDADAVAGSIGETLSIPVAGSTWAEILPFLEAQPFVFGTGGNFSGVLFSIIDGELKTQRPLDQYRDLTLAFGPTEEAARTAFQQGTRRSFGFDAPRPFGALDCSTPGVVDRCGLLHLEKVGDVDILVEAVTAAELTGVRYDTEAATAPFDPAAIASMDRIETLVGYQEQELGGPGTTSAAAHLYYAGDLTNTPIPLHDPRAGYSDRISAKSMLWVVDGQGDRTIYVTRSSLP